MDSESTPAGRPSKFKTSFLKQAEKLCKLGATDKQLADFFEVNIDTIYEWKKSQKGFSDAIKRGKEISDMEVANSLYNRAIGFSKNVVKIFQYEGNPVIVPYKEYFPPDPTSMIFWLKNRRPAEWRDKQEIDLNDGRVKIKVTKKAPSNEKSGS